MFSKLIFLLTRNHMHIFIMLITSVQSFKLIACKPWEELITQTCYPTLKANLKIVLSQVENAVILSKKYFFVCKNSHAPLQYIHNKYAWFPNDPLKTVREADYKDFRPYNAKSCLKWPSSKGCNSVKVNSSSTKNPHAHLQYVHNRHARFQKSPFKMWEELITQILYRKAWRMDGQTDGQTDGWKGANLNAPWLSSRGHKNKKSLLKMELRLKIL